MSQSKLHPEYLRQKALQDAYLARKNKKTDFYNGIYDRWENPVLTRESIPLSWRFDLDPETNPHFMERLGVNAVFNSGAIKLNGKYYLVARIEGNDRKSFLAWQRATARWRASTSGKSPSCCRTPARRRPTSTICA